MATRYIGSATIHIRYHDEGDYRGTVLAGDAAWPFSDLKAPAIGHGPGIAYDSSEAYDSMAASAVAFASYYTSHNRGDDTPDWAPKPETADAIAEATQYVQDEQGRYLVSRSSAQAAKGKGHMFA